MKWIHYFTEMDTLNRFVFSRIFCIWTKTTTLRKCMLFRLTFSVQSYVILCMENVYNAFIFLVPPQHRRVPSKLLYCNLAMDAA